MSAPPKSFTVLALSASAAVSFLVTTPAVAQERPLGRPTKSFATPQNFALEVRFSPYTPSIDDEPALGGKTPYRDTFGDTPRVLVGVEFDWQALRIPYLGSLGPGIGASYTKMGAKAKLTGTGTDSAEDTNLEIAPFYGVAVLRVDVLATRFGIPVVPFAKAGVGYALWRAYGPNGTSRIGDTAAKGGSFGTHFALGVALQLDFLERGAARALDEATGINHTYLWAEYYLSTLTGFGSPSTLRVGANSWAAGLAFEF